MFLHRVLNLEFCQGEFGGLLLPEEVSRLIWKELGFGVAKSSGTSRRGGDRELIGRAVAQGPYGSCGAMMFPPRQRTLHNEDLAQGEARIAFQVDIAGLVFLTQLLSLR